MRLVCRFLPSWFQDMVFIVTGYSIEPWTRRHGRAARNVYTVESTTVVYRSILPEPVTLQAYLDRLEPETIRTDCPPTSCMAHSAPPSAQIISLDSYRLAKIFGLDPKSLAG